MDHADKDPSTAIICDVKDELQMTYSSNEIVQETVRSNVMENIAKNEQSDDDNCNFFDDVNPVVPTKLMRNSRDQSAKPALKCICDMCGKRFFKKHRLVSHLRQHVGLKVCVTIKFH